MTHEKVVYLIRHGQTPSNLTKSIQGAQEPLNTLGQLQAERLAARLSKARKRYPITAILSSPFRRARETADAISKKLGIRVEEFVVFHECLHPSRIRGLPIDDPEVVRTLGEFTAHFHDTSFTYDDGETFMQRKARALKALALLESHQSDCIALVTHGVFATHLINSVLHGEELTSYMIERAPMMLDNTGMIKLVYGPFHTFSGSRIGWRLFPGDTSHLD